LALIVGLALVLLLTLLVTLLSLGRFTMATLGLTGGFWVFALFAFLFVAYIFTWIIVGHLVGRRILARDGNYKTNKRGQFGYVVIGLLVLEVLRAVPVLGFILAFLVASFALGGLFLYWLERRRADKVPAEAQTAVSA
jgi:hypothetical protein